VLLALLVLALPLVASANFFDDQGLVTARVRTDYNPDVNGVFNAGTSINPLVLDASDKCLWPDNTPNFTFVKYVLDSNMMLQGVFCPQGPVVYSSANFFSLNGGSTNSSYWVLSLNNEESFNEDPNTGVPGNPGPPNQSLPRALLGAGIMGFDAFKDTANGENFFRMHMFLMQNEIFPFINPVNVSQIPFMSIGAQMGRGNGSLITTINDPNAPQTLIWTSKLWSVLSPNGAGATNHSLIINATWGSKNRQMQLLLFHPGFETSYYDPETHTLVDPGQNSKWNWPAQGSFWHPGADIAFMDAEDASAACPGVSLPALITVPSEKTFSLNVRNLLLCASNNGLFDAPMPTLTPVPVTGIHWANEIAGIPPGLWVSVHGMKMQ